MPVGRLLDRTWQRLGGAAAFRVATGKHVPAGQPVPYRYEMQISKLPASEQPPRLAVWSPQTEGTRRLGEELHFWATATDGAGAKIPADPFQWKVYHWFIGPGNMLASHQGAEFSWRMPGSPAGLRPEHLLISTVSVTDAAALAMHQQVSERYRENYRYQVGRHAQEFAAA